MLKPLNLINKMKMTRINKMFFALAIILIAIQPSFAQEEITDEDLKNYAVIQMSVDIITSSISPTVNDLIRRQEGMTGQRFNELRQSGGEGAADWEKQFLATVNDLIDERREAAKEVVNLLINNSTLTGAKYSEIKKGLSSDSELKARYDEVMANLN